MSESEHLSDAEKATLAWQAKKSKPPSYAERIKVKPSDLPAIDEMEKLLQEIVE